MKSKDIDPDLRKVMSERYTNPNEKATSRNKGSIKKMVLPRAVDKMVLDNGLTPEQEAYSRARAFGMTQQEAIYFSTNGRCVTQLGGAKMEKEYPLVKRRINELNVQIAERVVESAAASKAWVLTRLMKIADRCMQAEPVMIKNEMGEEIESGEYRFDPTAANRSLELIGKELGMFATKVDINHNHVKTMTDDQVRNRVNELAMELGMPALEQLPAP